MCESLQLVKIRLGDHDVPISGWECADYAGALAIPTRHTWFMSVVECVGELERDLPPEHLTLRL